MCKHCPKIEPFEYRGYEIRNIAPFEGVTLFNIALRDPNGKPVDTFQTVQDAIEEVEYILKVQK